jgi:predicted transcriptional regulator
MATITICIDDATEERFRELAKTVIGEKKGYLGRAVTEAITLWIRDKEQATIAREALALLEKEHRLGKFAYRSREDIHDRKSCPD